MRRNNDLTNDSKVGELLFMLALDHGNWITTNLTFGNNFPQAIPLIVVYLLNF